MRRSRLVATTAVAVAAIALVGCGSDSSGDGECTSHYEQVAKAPTFDALKRQLVAKTPRAASVRIVGRDGDKRQVNVLSAKRRSLLSVDAWQLDDGHWTAEQWSQCID